MSGFDATDGDTGQAAAPSADAPASGALDELGTLADLDVEEHPAVFQRIHTELQGALASIDDA